MKVTCSICNEKIGEEIIKECRPAESHQKSDIKEKSQVEEKKMQILHEEMKNRILMMLIQKKIWMKTKN